MSEITKRIGDGPWNGRYLCPAGSPPPLGNGPPIVEYHTVFPDKNGNAPMHYAIPGTGILCPCVGESLGVEGDAYVGLAE